MGVFETVSRSYKQKGQTGAGRGCEDVSTEWRSREKRQDGDSLHLLCGHQGGESKHTCTKGGHQHTPLVQMTLF